MLPLFLGQIALNWVHSGVTNHPSLPGTEGFPGVRFSAPNLTVPGKPGKLVPRHKSRIIFSPSSAFPEGKKTPSPGWFPQANSLPPTLFGGR